MKVCYLYLEKNKMSIKYKTLSDIDHVLLRPEVHIGSTKQIESLEYVVDESFSEISEKQIFVSEAMIRIFVEVLANAVDNIHRSEHSSTPCKLIKVDVNLDGTTTIFNDGEIINVSREENEGIFENGQKRSLYNHELVFGQLRSGSNYDDTVVRETSGKNGLGVKCTNILSSRFKVTGVDPNNKKKLIQIWTNNMKNTNGPTVSDTKEKTGYTEVTYTPDFKIFGHTYNNDIIAIFRKYVLDVALSSQNVKIFFNGTKLPINKFIDYTKLFKVSEETIRFQDNFSEVVVAFNSNGVKTRNISFVNGLFTKDGGQHVDGWTKPFFAELLALLNKSMKDVKIAQKDIVNYFRVFVKSTVDKPIFDSQNKNKLKFPVLKYTIPKGGVLKVSKWEGIRNLKSKLVKKLLDGKNSEAIKTLNKKKSKVIIKEYDPANNAGTKRSLNCTLIVCEGLSAKTYAVAGINTGISFTEGHLKKGRDWFGILPLRGKFLNVRNSTNDKLVNNTVVTDLVNAMGLTFGMDYDKDKALNSLNYGSIIIIPDPDEDGIHIEGLVLNFFHYHFPTLLDKVSNGFPFISSMKIPIIRMMLSSSCKDFFTHEAFRRFTSKLTVAPKIKYFKGLGTTKHEDVPKIFGKKLVVFKIDPNTDFNMNKAFKNEESELRKEWLKNYNFEKRTFDLDVSEKVLSLNISTFIDEELIKFSIEDCKRSLPHLMDGQKESQRKVIFGIKQCKARESIKVAQLGAFVAQKTDYKHGEQNLFETIIKMAQNFVGANNLPLLEQDGQFGTRLSGGRDAANARYIFAKQSIYLDKIFRPEDDPILTYTAEGEPSFYAPVIPLICVNGSVGVGTGFSSFIPMYNPHDILDGIKMWIHMHEKGEKFIFKYKPWYNGFTGTIEKDKGMGRYISFGVLSKTGDEYVVSDLPINMWTDKFKEMCEQFAECGVVEKWKNYSDVLKVDFRIKSAQDLSIEILKLKTYIHTSNMVMFNHEGKIQKFETLNGILQRFCKERIKLYEKRRMYMLQKLNRKLRITENKMRFMGDVISQRIKILSEEDDAVIKQLTENNYSMELGSNDKKSFDYLLDMNIGGFRKRNILTLQSLIQHLKTEIQWYNTVSKGQMWLKDINELEATLLI